jgi:hypothetical protein
MALVLTLLDRLKNHIFHERKLMKNLALFLTNVKNSTLFNEFVCKLGSLWHEWESLKRELQIA